MISRFGVKNYFCAVFVWIYYYTTQTLYKLQNSFYFLYSSHIKVKKIEQISIFLTNNKLIFICLLLLNNSMPCKKQARYKDLFFFLIFRPRE